MTAAPDRADMLDRVLTGLAMSDAYTSRDTASLVALTEQIPPNEAVTSLLETMEVMTGIFAHQLRVSPAEVTASVRRRILREVANTAGGGRRNKPA